MNAKEEFTTLIRALELQPSEFEVMVRNRPSILAVTGPHGETLLHWLAVEARSEAVRTLARLGAKIDTVNEFGNTALMECSQVGKLEMVSLLLDLGANPHFQSPRDKNTPLHLAAQSGRMEVYDLLIARGADSMAKNKFGETPLDLLEFNRKWVKSP